MQETKQLFRALLEQALPLLEYATDDACENLLEQLHVFVKNLSQRQQEESPFANMSLAELLLVVERGGRRDANDAQNEREASNAQREASKHRGPAAGSDKDDDDDDDKEEGAGKKVSAPPRKRERSPSGEWTFETVREVERYTLPCLMAVVVEASTRGGGGGVSTRACRIPA